MIWDPVDLLNYGVLGAALFILLIAVAVMLRLLNWARSILVLVLDRMEDNTTALVRLSERLHGSEEVD